MPVVQYGPFVMNTREEIMQAIADSPDGRMEQIPPIHFGGGPSLAMTSDHSRGRTKEEVAT